MPTKTDARARTKAAPDAAGGPPPRQIRLDDSAIETAYANFCCVRATPEEVILDFGVNPRTDAGNAPVRLDQRIILNPFTAKRLLAALNASLVRHEAVFGRVETDAGKRAGATGERKAA